MRSGKELDHVTFPSDYFLMMTSTSNEEEFDDAPPSLVAANGALDAPATGVEAQLEELNIAKVPITIVTG